MTIREKLCQSGLNTLREWVCSAKVPSGVSSTMPKDMFALDFKTEVISANLTSSTYIAEQKTKTLHVVYNGGQKMIVNIKKGIYDANFR